MFAIDDDNIAESVKINGNNPEICTAPDGSDAKTVWQKVAILPYILVRVALIKVSFDVTVVIVDEDEEEEEEEEEEELEVVELDVVVVVVNPNVLIDKTTTALDKEGIISPFTSIISELSMALTAVISAVYVKETHKLSPAVAVTRLLVTDVMYGLL